MFHFYEFMGFESSWWCWHSSGQIIATSHDLGHQKVAKEGKSPYFRENVVGEILQFGQIVDVLPCFFLCENLSRLYLP